MCLRKDEIYNEGLNKQPNTIEDIVFPADGIERDRIDICVEEVAQTADELFKSKTLRALCVGEELDDVCVC